MHTNILEQVVYRSTSVPQQAFTVTVATDLVTSNAHGLQTGDKLQLTTATTLPGGLSLVTDYFVINPTTNTFQLSASPNGPAVNITDTGTGTHTYHLKGHAIYIGDAKDITLSIGFSNTPTMTVKLQGAITAEDNAPDFNAGATVLNRWDNIAMYAITTGETYITGGTGVSCTGSAAYGLYAIETHLTWLCVEITAYTQGNLDVRVSQYRQ